VNDWLSVITKLADFPALQFRGQYSIRFGGFLGCLNTHFSVDVSRIYFPTNKPWFKAQEKHTCVVVTILARYKFCCLKSGWTFYKGGTAIFSARLA
jgi:hypothetical protein